MGLLSRAAGSNVSGSVTKYDPDTIEGKIIKYCQTFSNFNCILFESTGAGSGDDKTMFCQRIAEMIKFSGIVIPLSAGRPLILLPPEADRELIAHRLSKNFNIPPIFSFEANSSENLINRINSLP